MQRLHRVRDPTDMGYKDFGTRSGKERMKWDTENLNSAMSDTSTAPYLNIGYIRYRDYLMVG